MNKKGFTLIEILAVIAIIGLLAGIVTMNVTKTGSKAKERLLLTKIKNIEKAAVLYGQDNRNKFTNNDTNNELCIDENDNYISNCYYFESKIKVSDLTKVSYDEDGNEIKYINADDESGNIINPIDKTKTLNDCEIQLYIKYGKIYASYIKENPNNISNDTKCFK